MTNQATRRNVFILALCQALSMTIMSISMSVTALNGAQLAPDSPWAATVPLSLQAIATMVGTIPASHLMRRRGRRFGFTLGALIGMTGGALGALAVFDQSFWLLCLSNICLGAMMGFGVFYRFAAADAADEAFRSRAISLVLAGGVFSALVGPTLSKYTRDLLSGQVYAGCYVAMIVIGVGVIALLPLSQIPLPSAAEQRRSGRPLALILRQPAAIVALLAGMIGYGVMAFLMTATPLAMRHHQFHDNDWFMVIEWHVLGMFAPSFVTGDLIKRFGVLNILGAGAVLMFAAAASNLAGLEFWNFWFGLVLLGLGWNFLYIGATSLLTETYRPEERAKVQGINDFLVFGTVAFGSLVSGGLHTAFGWTAVNYGVLPPVALTLASTLWLMARRRRVQPAE